MEQSSRYFLQYQFELQPPKSATSKLALRVGVDLAQGLIFIGDDRDECPVS
jgi:hypothetical protein